MQAQITNGQLVATANVRGALRSHLFVAVPATPPLLVPALGEWWLGPQLVLLDSGDVPVSGLRTTTVPVPPLPPGVWVALQAIVAQPSGIQLSTPSILTLD